MRFPVRFLVRVAPTERRVGVGLLPGIHTTIFVVNELKRHVLLLEKIVDDLPVRLAVGVWGFGIHPLVDFPVREFEKRLEIRPGSRCQFVDEAVGGSRIVTELNPQFSMANTVRMMVIAIFRVIKAPYIDRNLSIINCYAETVHVFRNFVHVIKNRLVGAPVHVIEKTVYVHENCCSRVLRILKRYISRRLL